jgi:hypothetical protein
MWTDKVSYIQLLHLFHWEKIPYGGKENVLRKMRTEDEGEDDADKEEGDKEKEKVRVRLSATGRNSWNQAIRRW